MDTIAKHIETTPGICSGRPRIAGTRIRIANIVIWTENGMSPDEIVTSYPHLTLADVHAALAFYHDHRDEIDQQMCEDEEFVAEMKAKTGPGPIEQNLSGTDENRDSISP